MDAQPDEAARLISQALPVAAEAPAKAREALGDLDDILAPDVLRDAKLLVSELVTHRVRRLPQEREGTLGLDVSVTRQRVRVQVVDDDRESAPPPGDSGEPELGWELQIVAQIADRWGIRRDRLTTVWFELDR